MSRNVVFVVALFQLILLLGPHLAAGGDDDEADPEDGKCSGRAVLRCASVFNTLCLFVTQLYIALLDILVRILTMIYIASSISLRVKRSRMRETFAKMRLVISLGGKLIKLLEN